MKPSEIISLARRQTWCTEDIVTSDEAIKFLNFVIEDFWADIRNSDSWYWFDILEIDVTWWQSTYTFTWQWAWELSGRFPIHKIQAVWLYDGNNKKRVDLPVHFVDKVDLNKRESVKEPLACFITRTELNLIPTPKSSTKMQIWGFNYSEIMPFLTITGKTSWNDPITATFTRYPQADWTSDLEVKQIWWQDTNQEYIAFSANEELAVWEYLWCPSLSKSFEALTVESTFNDTESEIWIPARWHYILVEWMKYWMYWNMWVNFEAARTNSRAFYDSEKDKAIQNIVDRWQLADTAYFPDLNFLNY